MSGLSTETRASALTLTASLPHPPGINRTYRSTTGGHWYKTDAVATWEQSAMIYLRLAGFRSQPPGPYWLSLSCDVYSRPNRDLDGTLKLLIDTVSAALAIDDRYLGQLSVVKIPVQRREDQRIEIRAEIRPLADARDFERLAHLAAAGD